MIRGLNSIHGQAFDPQTEAEKRNFAGYALCLTEFTHHHHAAVTPSNPFPWFFRPAEFPRHFIEPHPPSGFCNLLY